MSYIPSGNIICAESNPLHQVLRKQPLRRDVALNQARLKVGARIHRNPSGNHLDQQGREARFSCVRITKNPVMAAHPAFRHKPRLNISQQVSLLRKKLLLGF